MRFHPCVRNALGEERGGEDGAEERREVIGRCVYTTGPTRESRYGYGKEVMIHRTYGLSGPASKAQTFGPDGIMPAESLGFVNPV